MSWEAFIDEQILKNIPCLFALICSNQDGSIWAIRNNINAPITQDELKHIITNFNDKEEFFSKGIKIGGEKYICLTAEKNLLRARLQKNALCVVACQTCVIVAACNETAGPPGKLNMAVEALADYLRGLSY